MEGVAQEPRVDPGGAQENWRPFAMKRGGGASRALCGVKLTAA